MNRFFFDQELILWLMITTTNDSTSQPIIPRCCLLPDSTNPARHGQGIRVSVRLIESNHPLLKDALFLVYDIKNEGSQNYSKVVFGQLMGNYIGVTSTEDYGEYNNDVSSLFKGSNFVLNSNFGDTTANPLWVGRIGKFGHAFVEAPNNNHLASYDCFSPSNQVRLGDDESLWQRLTPGTFQMPATFQVSLHPASGEDADYLCGTEYFSISSGTTKRIAVVLAYGYLEEEIELKVELARMMWNLQFDLLLGVVQSSAWQLSFRGNRKRHADDSLDNFDDKQYSRHMVYPRCRKELDKAGSRHSKQRIVQIGTQQQFLIEVFGMLRILVKDSTGHAYGCQIAPHCLPSTIRATAHRQCRFLT